ncbi:MAG: hypothetical protein ABII94_04275, partial [Patescibacteria group bacterium]
KDFRDVRKQYLKQKGSAAEPDVMDLAELGIAAMIAPAIVTVPVTTAVVITGFMVADKGIREAINLAKSVAMGQKYEFGAIKDYSDILSEDANQATKNLVDIIGFIGSAATVSKGHKLIGNKMPVIMERMTKNVIEKYNLPRKMYINSKEVRSIFIYSKNISKQKAEILIGLGLDAAGYKHALKNGLEIELPAERLTTLVDKPYWAKLKKLFHVKPTKPITERMFTGGKPTVKSTVASEPVKTPERVVPKQLKAPERVAPKQPVVEEKTKPLKLPAKVETKIVPKELESFKSAEEFVAANHFERISNEIISGKIKKTDIPSIIDQENEFRGLFKRNGETFVTEGAGAIWSVYYSQIHERGLTPMKAFKEVELLFDLNAKTKSQLTDIYNQAVKEAKSSEVIKEKKLPEQPVVKEEKVERVVPVKVIEAMKYKSAEGKSFNELKGSLNNDLVNYVEKHIDYKKFLFTKDIDGRLMYLETYSMPGTKHLTKIEVDFVKINPKGNIYVPEGEKTVAKIPFIFTGEKNGIKFWKFERISSFEEGKGYASKMLNLLMEKMRKDGYVLMQNENSFVNPVMKKVMNKTNAVFNKETGYWVYGTKFQVSEPPKIKAKIRGEAPKIKTSGKQFAPEMTTSQLTTLDKDAFLSGGKYASVGEYAKPEKTDNVVKNAVQENINVDKVRRKIEK